MTKPGRFQLASGGTLFLDEIGELPLTLQAKILRALQERIVEPLGSVTPVAVDVRFVAATNRDLPTMIAEGKFREDLYYRLSILEIRIPPLRERSEDIPLLVNFLLHKLGRKNNKPVRSVSREFLAVLMRHEWKGNVRELENVLERALILCRADILDVQSLPSGNSNLFNESSILGEHDPLLNKPRINLNNAPLPALGGPNDKLDGEADIKFVSLIITTEIASYHHIRNW